MDGDSITNTNVAGIVIEPLITRDDSAEFGLGPVPHSGKVEEHKRRVRSKETRDKERSFMWIGIVIFAGVLLTVK